MTLPTTLPLNQIRIDGWTQPRTTISEGTVKDYADAKSHGATFPPVDVFFDGVEYWLADGFHRYHAYRQIALNDIDATVHQGTRRDAVLFSVGVNDTHGLRRTNADKRNAVMTLLNDEEWTQWSNAEIARRCRVGHQLANDLRLSLAESASEKPASRTYTTKHGTEATMQIEKIGRGGGSQPAASEPPKFNSRTEVTRRRDQMREMAAEGHTSRQIAAALNMTEVGCRATLKKAAIHVPADRVAGGLHRHDSTRIVNHIVMDAENLIADVDLINFGELDSAHLSGWLSSLNASRNQLNTFIRRLKKEQQEHGEAA